MSGGRRRGLPPVAAGVSAPADRRFRRSDVRPGSRRAWRSALRAGLRWGVPSLLLAGGGLWLSSAALSSEAMKVDRIVVRGNQHLTLTEVETLLAGLRDENILRVDFEKYRRQMLDSPWVADVSMSRQLPSTIELQVTERVPMAIARLGPQLFLVDETGVIMDEFGAQYREFNLPIIDGLLRGRADEVDAADPARVKLVRTFLAAITARADLRQHLSQVDVSRERNVVVMLDEDTAWLHLGADKFVERLSNYIELAPTLQEQFTEIDYVDLRFDDHVYVKSRGRTATAAATTKKK